MGLGSVSLNMFWNPSIKGSSFLQASMKGIHTYAKKVDKVNILGGTKFPLLNRNMKQLYNQLGGIRSQVGKISANPIKLDIKSAGLKEARKDITAIGAEAKQYAFYTKKANENLNKPIRKFPTQNTRQNKSNKRVSGGGSVMGTAMTLVPLLMPLKGAIDFESALVSVQAKTDTKYKKDLPLLEATITKLGGSTEWTMVDVAQGAEYLTMAGFNPKQIQASLGGVLALATVGDLDLSRASDISSNILKSFGKRASNMDRISDVMAKTITTSNVNITEMGESMKMVGSVATSVRGSTAFLETTALVGVLADVGLKGTTSGTHLKGMITNLGAPSKIMTDEINALGVSAFASDGKMKAISSIIGDISTQFKSKGYTDQQKITAMKNIFGKIALPTAQALLAVGEQGILNYQARINDSAGEAKRIQDMKLNTVLGQFKLFVSSINAVGIAMSKTLLPKLKSFIRSSSKITDSIKVWAKENPILSASIYGLGIAVGVGALALAGFGFIASGVAASLALMATPVTAIVLGIMAIGAGAVYLYNKFSFVKSAVNSFFSGMSESLSVPMLQIQLLFSEVGSSLSRFFSALSPVFSAFGTVLGALGLNFKSVGSVIGSAFSIALIPIKLMLTALSSVLDMVSMVIEGYTKMAEHTMAFGGNVVDGASSAWSGTKSFFGFPDDKNSALKATTPANNIDFKSLQTLPIESVSDITSNQINETKTLMQNSNSNKAVQQNITNQITVTTTDGVFDKDDFVRQVAEAQKEIAHDEQDMQMQDVS